MVQWIFDDFKLLEIIAIIFIVSFKRIAIKVCDDVFDLGVNHIQGWVARLYTARRKEFESFTANH